MPMALIEASNCASMAGGTGGAAGIVGIALSERGSTLRNSVMVVSLGYGFLFSFLREDDFRPPHVRPAGQGRAAGTGALRATHPCGDGRLCGSGYALFYLLFLFLFFELVSVSLTRRLMRPEDRATRDTRWWGGHF